MEVMCKPSATSRRVAALVLAAVAALASPASAQEPAADPFPAPAPAPAAGEGREAAPAQNLVDLMTENPIVVAASVAPFVIASLIALWFGAERLVVLRRGRVIPKPFVSRFLELLKSGQLDAPAALELCERNDSPVAHVFAHGVRKWGKPSVEVEQAIIDGGERQVAQLRRHLRILNGVATVTPLIGLLGTVLGMIMAFFQIAEAEGADRTTQVAFGITTALGTTALGLTVAIPALILYMYLAGRIDALVMEMDDLAQQVVQQISGEGLAASRQADRTASRGRAKAEAV